MSDAWAMFLLVFGALALEAIGAFLVRIYPNKAGKIINLVHFAGIGITAAALYTVFKDTNPMEWFKKGKEG